MKKIKLNLTKDFCNCCKDLCNVFKAQVNHQINWKKKEKSPFVIRLLSIKGNLGLSKHLQWRWNKHLLFKVPCCSLMDPAQRIHWSTFFFKMRELSVWKRTKWLNYKVLFENTLIPSHSGVSNPIIKRFQCFLARGKKEHKA